MTSFILLDIETTGLSPARDKIIEIGIALVNLKTREIEKTFESLINPGVAIPRSVTNLTGIKDEDLKDAPKLEDVKKDVIEFVKDYPIAGHNINFDLEFLNTNGFGISNTRLDSMDLAHITFPKEKSYSLEVLGRKLDIKDPGKHRALKDVIVNTEAIFKLIDIYFSKTKDISKTIGILEKSENNWKDVLIFSSRNFKKTTEKAHPKEQKKHTPRALEQLAKHALIEGNYDIQDLITQEEKTIIATSESPDEYEDVFQLLTPNQYLNKDLFAHLLSKETLTSEETVFALKTMHLIDEELVPKPKLHLPQNIKSLWFDYAHKEYPHEVSEKIKSSRTIITDHYTLVRAVFKNKDLLKNTHLIITDTDDFYQNAKKALTAFYSTKRFKSIEQEFTMLMALLGMIHAKNNANYGLKIDDQITASKEWQQCKDLVEKINKSSENIEDNEEKSLIEFLHKAVSNISQVNAEITVNQSGDPALTLAPKNIGEILSEKLWTQPEKLTLISTALTFKGENPPCKFLKAQLNLPLDTVVEKTTSNDLEIEIANDLPNQKSQNFSAAAAHKLERELQKMEKPVYILTNSKPAAEQLHSHLALAMKEQGITVLAQDISGGLGKIELSYKNSKENCVLIGTYDFWRIIKPEINTLIIFKLPFPPPCDLPFQDYALPVTMLKIKKIGTSAKRLISLDSRITQFL